MVKGTILKGIGGLYSVRTEDGIHYECQVRGKFRNKKIIPLVGDEVMIAEIDSDKLLGVIEEILPRKSELLRPQVANVTQVVLVFAIKDPDPNINLLDKMLTLSEYNNMSTIICLNKCDLDDGSYEKLEKIYSKAGYQVIKTCSHTMEGIDTLRDALKGEISVFAGPSGVGKSSLLNVIQEGLALKTGELSDKIKRGKHTTRHSELLILNNGGFVVDTPGFTSLNISFIEEEELEGCFKEFESYKNHCKFNNCLHKQEPGCAIKEAIKNEEISEERYESYLYFLNEIQENRRHKKW